jgi:hypothetical protein
MTDERRSRPTTRAAAFRYPDDEARWITLPADLICCAVALSDNEFAEFNQYAHENKGARLPRSQRK